MFAPQIARSQTTTTADLNSLERQGTGPATPSYSAIGRSLLPRLTIGNQPTPRSDAQRPGQEGPAENMAAVEERPTPAWNFGKIPALPPRRPSQSRPAAAQLPSALQAKLVIGSVNDPLEHEADRAADRVMRMPSPSPAVAAAPPQLSRKCASCQEKEENQQLSRKCSSCQEKEENQQLNRKCASCQEKEEKLHTKSSDASHAGDTAPGIVHSVLATSGRALDTPARSFLEPRFGRSLVDVRVHDDAQASRSAAAVGARAYTVGPHIVFGSSEYRPSDPGGMRLLAHEVAHVAQQGGAQSRPKTTQSSPKAAESNPKAASRSGTADKSELASRSETVADTQPATPALTPSVRRLQRYSQSGCADADLKSKIWPGDGIAKDMVAKAIRVLSATPIAPAATALLLTYFMSATPNVAAILAVYNKIKSDFDGDSYTYECDDDCDDCSYVRSRMRYILLNPNIHLCMNKLGSASTQCFGYLMVHEFAHYSGHCADNAYCHSGCCFPTSCPTTLSEKDALDNADSYGSFANDLYNLSGI